MREEITKLIELYFSSLWVNVIKTYQQAHSEKEEEWGKVKEDKPEDKVPGATMPWSKPKQHHEEWAKPDIKSKPFGEELTQKKEKVLKNYPSLSRELKETMDRANVIHDEITKTYEQYKLDKSPTLKQKLIDLQGEVSGLDKKIKHIKDELWSIEHPDMKDEGK
jgi:hypothetical protein